MTQYQTWGPQSYEETQQFINVVLDKESNWIYNVLVDPDTDKVIGAIQLAIDEVNQSAEINFIVHPNYWGDGVATDIAKTIIKYAFKVLKLNRIGAAIDSNNIASGIVLEKLGMKREGMLRKDKLVQDEYRDTLIYGLLRSEY
ncbi:GNAT family N-acetyltransferase [Staphylococcus xylosus]|uniref:Putative GNAT family acetyltransferase n=1 Tax=Staphylococcus xylosus TaxID=1288 RepID=A0A1W7M1Z2_STAXY|nr:MULTISPECIES: GNAT family protein [Staphylococcus]CZT31745.1 putative GNAT family acetyltransferase [Staphylococcus xylosus]SUM91713.1 Ribosomal-protein-L7p-serine acetyltransferase [Staphylococcus equorum]